MVEARYLHDFFAVQMVFLILVLYYSFSRTECPCPKSYTGRECYDKDDHWNVCDFDIRVTAGVRAMWCRFRKARCSAGAAGGAAEHGGLGVPRRCARFQVVARQVVLAAAAVARRGSRPSLADVLGQG